MEQKTTENCPKKPEPEIPEGCPGKWTLSKICFDCLAKNPRIICPEYTEEDLTNSRKFPKEWREKEREHKR